MGAIATTNANNKMAMTPVEWAMNIVAMPFVLIHSALITIFSALIINGIVGFIVLLCRPLPFMFRPIIRMQSTVLETWFSLFAGHSEHFGGFTVRLTGDKFESDETAIVLSNHRSWIDSVLLISLARNVGRGGDFKFMAKKSLLLFPVFGLVGAVTDSVVFIEREAKKAGAAMSSLYHRLVDQRRRDLPFWFIIFPEGTRRTNKKLAKARDFAKKRDLQPLDHVLQPRTKGFVTMSKALRGTASAIYDVTIAYGTEPSEDVRPSFLRLYFTTALQNRVIHVHQRRIPIENVPVDEEAAKVWLYKLFEQKDTMIDKYYKKGQFEGPLMRWNRITVADWLSANFYCTATTALYCALAYALYSYFRG